MAIPPHVISRPALTGWYPQYTQVAAMETEMSTVPAGIEVTAMHANTNEAVVGMVWQPQASPALLISADPADQPAAQAMTERPTVPTVGLHWTVLPALTTPNLPAMRAQATAGCALVLGIVVACVSATHTAMALGDFEGPLLFLFLGTVWTAALVAVVCLSGLMFGDPGVIARSEERCMPVPNGPIREQLLTGQTLTSDMRNVADPTHGTYCVRCLIWRTTADKAHHCSTCQRCVRNFDHHCGVFGRCIAGTGFGGNMGYFKVIIGMAVLGGVTTGAAMLSALSRQSGWEKA